jgi:hypothetical protein
LKSVLIFTTASLAVGGLYLGGAFDRGQVYDLPIAEARSRLSALSLPSDAVAPAGGHASVGADSTKDGLAWNVSAGGDASSVFAAHLKAEGPGRTRVTLDYRNGTSSPWADRLMATRFMRSYAEASFHEQVDAALRARRPDQGRALQDFATHAAAHPEEVREVGLATQEIFKDVANQVERMRAAESVPPPTSARESMAAATRPSADATRPSVDLQR